MIDDACELFDPRIRTAVVNSILVLEAPQVDHRLLRFMNSQIEIRAVQTPSIVLSPYRLYLVEQGAASNNSWTSRRFGGLLAFGSELGGGRRKGLTSGRPHGRT